MRKPLAFGRRRRGAVMVEFLVALPVVLLLLVATGEFARLFMHYNALNQGLRDGARYLASTLRKGSTGVVEVDADALTEASNLVIYGNVVGVGTPMLPGLEGATIQVVPTGPGDFSLAATYAYQPLLTKIPMIVSGTQLSTSFSLNAEVRMRAL